MKKIKLLGLISLFILSLSACDKKTYQISYVVDNDKTITATYDKGKVLTSFEMKEDAPYEKEGYTRDQYYFDNLFTEPVMYPYTVTEDKSLYLRWVKNLPASYKITFYDGDSIYKEVVITEGELLPEPLGPDKEDYQFAGWVDSAFNQFDFSKPIDNNYELYAKWNYVSIDNGVVSGYNEGIYAIMPYTTIEPSSYTISYSLANQNNFKAIDSELIRKENNSIRADILGLKSDIYDVKIECAGKTEIIEDIIVYESDKSGYAHFNYAGVGAYNDDGSLKDDAVVIYVTNETKNTVEAQIGDKTCVGLAQILQAQSGSNKPLNIRILDTIGAATWSKSSPAVSRYSEATTSTVKGLNNQYLELKNYSEADLINGGFNSLDESTYTKLNGLTNKIKYDSSKKEFDSYYNMLDINGAKNVTVEGVGEKAGLFQWGFTWKNSSSIEVRNLTFKDYTEDACSFEGADESLTLQGFNTNRIWVHNNTFYKGVNYWDVCSEQDKHDGDGSLDLKRLAYVTISYNEFIKNHKTGLVGGSDSQHTAAITYHHNFYNECQSRLPFARQANMHMYNNYYYKSTGNNMQIYAGAYAFIENCYFDNTKNTFTVRTADGKAAAVKSYNNIYNNCSSNGATIVSSRTEAVSNDNLYGKTFDTNSSIFYYNDTTQTSDVLLLNNTEDVPTIVPNYAGAGANYYKSILQTKSANSFIITLKNGDETFLTLKVYEGSKAKCPTNVPTSTSLFKCWVDENNNEFDWSTIITSNITLHASYVEAPTYEGLKASQNKVADYDFSNTTAGQTLPQFISYDTKGVFGNTNGTDYTIANAAYTGSAVQTVDNDERGAAYIIVSCGEAYESGIVKGWVDLSIGEQKGSKWALLTFIDKDGLAVLKIGANSSSYLAYSLGSDPLDNGEALENSAIAKNAKYSIYFEFDLNTGTTTLIINNTLHKIQNAVTSLQGFYTMTNNKGTGSSARVVTLDNIIIVKED